MEPQAAADSSPSAARSLTQKAASWVLRASSSLPAMVSRSNSGTLSSKVEPVPLVAISGKALEEYHDLFAMMDQDGSGDVSLDELKVMFKNMQIRVADSEIKSIVIAMDADKSGTVSFPGERRRSRTRCYGMWCKSAPAARQECRCLLTARLPRRVCVCAARAGPHQT